MRGDKAPKIRTVQAGDLITEQGAEEDDVFLVLDGVVGVEVDGEPLAELGPGALLGERAILEGGSARPRSAPSRPASWRSCPGTSSTTRSWPRSAPATAARTSAEPPGAPPRGAGGRQRPGTPPPCHPVGGGTWTRLTRPSSARARTASWRRRSSRAAGWKVALFERNALAGGAVASAPLTLPGYTHDPYSAFYGILHSSPVFSELGLDRRVEWARFAVPVAAAVSPEAVALIHADLARPPTAWPPGPPRTARPGSTSTAWWEKLGTKFFSMMLSPIGLAAPRRPVGLAARRYGLFDTAQMQLAAHRRHRPGALRRRGQRPGALAAGATALRRRRRHAGQRPRRA